MTRPMYEIPKPRKNAKKVIENPIVKPKRKKLVLNFVQRLEAVNTYKHERCAELSRIGVILP